MRGTIHQTAVSRAVAALAACVLIGSIASAQAQLETDFDSPTYTFNQTLSGQPASYPAPYTYVWDYINGNVGNSWFNQPDTVALLGAPFNTGAGDYEAIIGGLSGRAPSNVAPGSILELFPIPPVGGIAGVGSSNPTFNVDFAVTSSNLALPSDDAFGWTFRSYNADMNASTAFLRMMFEPLDATDPSFNPLTDNPNNTLRVVWYDANNTLHTTGYKIYRDSTYYNLDMQLDLAANTFSASITDAFNTTMPVVTNGAIAGFDPIDVGTVAATWQLRGADYLDATAPYDGFSSPTTDPYGYNGMIFDNYALIPEASSIMYGVALVIGAAFIGRRRREEQK